MSSGFNLGQSGNATEVGAGVVKLATQAQVDAKQADDGGIPLVVTPDKIPSESVFPTDYLAKEAITAGDAIAKVVVDKFDTVYVYNETSTASNYLLDEGRPRAQEFQISAAGEQPTVIRAFSTGSQTPTLRLSVRLTLDGADLASTTFVGNGSVVTLDCSGVTFLPSTTYYIIFEDIGGAADGNWFGVSNVDQGGAWYFNGSVWQEQNITHWAQVYYLEQTEFVDTIVKAHAQSLTENGLNMIGFAVDNYAIDEAVTVSNKPILEGSGFTPGSMYYLSDTPGAISDTPGTIEREIGRAVSATQILRKRGAVSPIVSPPDGQVYAPMTFSASAGNSATINGSASFVYGGPWLNAGDNLNNGGATTRARIMDMAGAIV